MMIDPASFIVVDRMQEDFRREPYVEAIAANRAAPPQVQLADFRISPRVLLLVLMATVVGSLGTLAAGCWAI